MMILAGVANMPLKIYPASSGPCGEGNGAVDREGNDDRFPIHIAGPIIIALSLSLWVGIGLAVSALL